MGPGTVIVGVDVLIEGVCYGAQPVLGYRPPFVLVSEQRPGEGAATQ